MIYLFFILVLMLGALISFSTQVIIKNSQQLRLRNKQFANRILKIVRISPIIVLPIIIVILHFYLKTNFIIRLSHAWIVMQLWIFSTLFYSLTILMSNIKKTMMALTIASMLISAWIAIYLTPLYHYEMLFKGIDIIICNIVGVIMLVITYLNCGVLQRTLYLDRNYGK